MVILKQNLEKKILKKEFQLKIILLDLVISNCVINLTTTDKVSTFNEINRILKPNSGGS